MKVKNIGPNMIEVITNDGTEILISYETPVAVRSAYGTFRTEHQWSATTFRHINKWLGDYDRAKVVTKPQEFFDNLL